MTRRNCLRAYFFSLSRVSWNRAVSWFEPCSGISTDRQTQYKHRTFAQFARRRHIATHHARELAGDGEAETGAAEALRGRSLGLAECLEQLCLLLRRHANAGIRHRQLDPVASVNHPSRSQLDLTLFGELAGIAQQVAQYLPQPHGVHGEGPRFSWASTMRRFLFFSASCPAVPMTSLISGASSTVCGLNSSFPASIFDRSSTWLMRPRR